MKTPALARLANLEVASPDYNKIHLKMSPDDFRALRINPNELPLDQGLATPMGNGGIAITKIMFGKQVSIQLHVDETRALRGFLNRK